jgi:hypothetical protein
MHMGRQKILSTFIEFLRVALATHIRSESLCYHHQLEAGPLTVDIVSFGAPKIHFSTPARHFTSSGQGFPIP